MSMRHGSLSPALLPACAVVFALAGFSAGFHRGRGGADDLAKVAQALELIQQRYYGNVGAEKAIDGAMEGMIAKLDPYCEYYTAAEYKEFEGTAIKGEFGGVGIVLGIDRATGFFMVETPIEETPAFAADILPGDQIREVDGKSVKGLAMAEVVRRVKGAPGTKVALTLARKGRDPFKVELTRAVIQVKAVKAKMLEGGIGYIRISDFTDMMKQFDAESKKLLDQGMKALVIDLRFNGGGLLDACVDLSDRFLDSGVIVTTQGKANGDKLVREAKKGDTLPPIPLVVLVNQATASASEVFSGAMKDTGRGTIVGARTFGKGSVQTPFPLPDGSRLKLTTARYFTPKGVSVHKEEGKKDFGIEPDFRIEMSQEEEGELMKVWNAERVVKGEKPAGPEGFVDHQLKAGLEVLRAKLESREPKVEARLLEKAKQPEKPSEN